MNKLILLILFVSVTQISQSQIDTLYHSSGTISEIGHMSSGLKSGQWFSYYENGNIASEGNYKEGQKTGKWNWYHENGNIWCKEKYKNDQFKKGKFWNKDGEQITISDVIVKPEYPGGEEALRLMIAKNLIYPSLAQENGIQGKVYVYFVISKDGEVTNAKVTRSVHQTLDEEALRVVNSLPRWKPGEFHGKIIKVSHTLPINFKLE
ncbi:TonB family protein [Carboxylicivirga sediminis]|uniref:TonB family protein n=1 Tax=Carboxylicivirga sediminis TaxID=2006564 RepID=A0A941F8I3_9BACT|nr:energy transducer TonB [Carboxylicivirga sediminis]MBR8538344.1 TonB family protein [Carboxylicivirga sediminis]